MIRSQLVRELLADYPHLYRRDVENVVDAIIGEMVDALVSGGRVELRGFGVFYVRRRLARAGRNPRTGEAVLVSEKLVPFFKMGKEMCRRLNKGLT